LTPLVLKIENFGQNRSSRAEKLATSLFLYEESEKIGPETICRAPRFQLGRFLLTLSLNRFLDKIDLNRSESNFKGLKLTLKFLEILKIANFKN
jgi:hypothetical protein